MRPISLLTGHHERRRYHDQLDGLFTTGRTSTGTETVPTYRPGDIRRIGRGRVLIIHRHLSPILARTRDVRHRPDWPLISNHIRTVRTGTIPIGPDGLVTAISPTPSTPADDRA